jgi:hypothetical protein
LVLCGLSKSAFIMANEYKCKNCGHQESTHDCLIDYEQKGEWLNNDRYREFAKQMKADYPKICYNYQKTDEEIEYDKTHPK